MPELPEVETLARHLHHLLAGAVFSSVEVCWLRSVAMPTPQEFACTLPGRTILGVGRRGKFVQFSLSDSYYLLVHLRMSGQLQVKPLDTSADKHARLIFNLTNGRKLVFYDPRKFGRVYLATDPTLVTGELGPEPLSDDFTPDVFAALLSRHKAALKPLLLNQAFLAGLGNIYTDEALFAAGLHPLHKANTLTPTEVERLYLAIREVLQQAIRNRGTTLPDARYRDAEGQPGNNQEYLRVYRRTGEPCPRCGTPIERVLVGQRGTHYCPNCQK